MSEKKKVPMPAKLIFKTLSDYLKHVDKTMGEIHVGVLESSKGKK